MSWLTVNKNEYNKKLFLLKKNYLLHNSKNRIRLKILSNSMKPVFKRGDIVYIKSIEINNIKIGDIIAYFHNGYIVVHRVIEIFEYQGENVRFRTKGDNNNASDAYYVSKDDIVGIRCFL